MRNYFTMLACVVALGGQSGSFADEPVKADNSANNHGALAHGVATAEKQGNRRSDVKTLARIRRRVIREKGLSFNAKNVKILFKGGDVTLTGPVNSDAEKAKLEEIAKGTGGVLTVNNLLTVAPK